MSTAQQISLALATVACAFDLRTRRIPQMVTLGGAAAGLVFQTVNGGWAGGAISVTGWLVGTAVFLVPFVLGGLGAGDVKLLGALGAWLGPADVIWLALYTGIAGGILALLVAAATGYLRRALANVRVLLVHWRMNGLRPLPELTLERTRAPRLAYALPILAGTLATLFFR